MNRMFTGWFATLISEAVKSRKVPEDIDNTLKLSALEPLQAKWIMELYAEWHQSRLKMLS